jgi:hypothetical protein
MMKNSIACRLAGLLGGALLLATQAHGALINVDNTTTVSIPGVSTFTVFADAMAGMEVTATFVSGLSETRVWAADGPGLGSVTGTSWSLAASGDTFFDNAWTFDHGAGNTDWLTSLLFNGDPGLTVFDMLNGAFGTPDSANGKPFASTLAGDGLIAVTYSEIVQIGVTPAVGDLYQRMFVNFDSPNLLTTRGVQRFQFSQDTDFDSRIDLPEPGALSLMGLGLLGLGWRRRSRQKNIG